MRDLSILREGWEAIEAEETRLLRALTVQESVRQCPVRAFLKKNSVGVADESA